MPLMLGLGLGFKRLSTSDNLERIVNLYKNCYNSFDNYKIKYGKYRNYFKNLSEVEILAIHKLRNCEELDMRRRM